MKKITIRHFSRNFYSCLEELPVIVTKRGKPYLKIERFNVTTKDEIVTTNNDTTTPNVTTEVTTSKKEAFNELKNQLHGYTPVPKPVRSKKKKWTPWKQNPESMGSCQGRECKKAATEMVEIATLEGEDITKRLCKMHAAQARKERGY